MPDRNAELLAADQAARRQAYDAYSLTYDWRRNLFVCHVYNATTYAEAMPR